MRKLADKILDFIADHIWVFWTVGVVANGLVVIIAVLVR